MSRRSELEKEIKITQNCIDSAPANTPNEVIEQWKKQLASLSFELNNLYDDQELQDS